MFAGTRREHIQRTMIDRELAQLLRQFHQRRCREAGSHLAAIDQPLLLIVIRQQQSPEVTSAPAAR